MNNKKSIIGNENRRHLSKIIFETDTPEGKGYDIVLILAIIASVACVMMDSVSSIHLRYGRFLYMLEWFFTLLFTVDYIVRIVCAEKPSSYTLSCWGIIDFLGVIPTYIGLISPVSRYLIAIRILRVLRVFRVLRLVSYVKEARAIVDALKACRRRIAVFLITVLTLVTFLGSLMYVIEGETNGFTSIPRSLYWAIVTLTTVGYGDISPQTGLGQAMAALIMILGYSIIVVPTGIVTVEMAAGAGSDTDKEKEPPSANHRRQGYGAQEASGDKSGHKSEPESARIPDKIELPCRRCGSVGHDRDANFCKYCASKL